MHRKVLLTAFVIPLTLSACGSKASPQQQAALEAKAQEIRQFIDHQCDHGQDKSVPLMQDVKVDSKKRKVVVSIGHDSGFKADETDQAKVQDRFGSSVIVKHYASGGAIGCAIPQH